IALGILAASGQINGASLREFECVGELSLGGELRPVTGVLPVAIQAKRAGRALITPRENAGEAALAEDGKVLAASHLLEVCAHLNGQQRLPFESNEGTAIGFDELADFADVHGHYQAKRA